MNQYYDGKIIRGLRRELMTADGEDIRPWLAQYAEGLECPFDHLSQEDLVVSEEGIECFSWDEMRCSSTQLLPPSWCITSVEFALFLSFLVRFRGQTPLRVSSWYRHPTHPVEAVKINGAGSHSTGMAVDLMVRDERAFALLNDVTLAASVVGAEIGIGVSQRKGLDRFVHVDWDARRVDIADERVGSGRHKLAISRPRIWSY